MSPSTRHTIVFLPSKLTGGLNSDPFWVDEAVCSALYKETVSLFEGVTASLEPSAPPSLDHPLPPFNDDYLSSPSTSSGLGAECFDYATFTFAPSAMSFGVRPDEIFGNVYQDAYNEIFQSGYETSPPVQALGIYEAPPRPPTPYDDPVDSITQTLSGTHLPPDPADPSTARNYIPSLDHSYDDQATSASEKASVASPPTSSSASSHYDSSKLDGESDIGYSSSSDEDEYRPTWETVSWKKRKVRARAKFTRTTASSPIQSSASESEKSVASSRSRRRSHPYKSPVPSRNFQSRDGARLINKAYDFQCPVAGCDYIQRNRRVPDLKRHVVTHDRWMEPEKWTCCGVGMERAHLYGLGIEEGMSREEQIEAGAYMFGGRLMIGGCLNTFARRDALKRHIDNRKISCVGHMDSYPH